jgi:antitoxin CcdA
MAKMRAVQLSLDAALVSRAEQLGVDLDEAAVRGITQEMKVAEQAGWADRNRDAISSFNRYVDDHGTVGDGERRYG